MREREGESEREVLLVQVMEKSEEEAKGEKEAIEIPEEDEEFIREMLEDPAIVVDWFDEDLFEDVVHTAAEVTCANYDQVPVWMEKARMKFAGEANDFDEGLFLAECFDEATKKEVDSDGADSDGPPPLADSSDSDGEAPPRTYSSDSEDEDDSSDSSDSEDEDENEDDADESEDEWVELDKVEWVDLDKENEDATCFSYLDQFYFKFIFLSILI